MLQLDMKRVRSMCLKCFRLRQDNPKSKNCLLDTEEKYL